MDNFFHAFGNAVGGAVNWVTSALNNEFAKQQKQRQIQQQQYQQVANQVFKLADSTLQSLTSSVQKANPYQGMKPLEIVGSIGKSIADQPLLNLTPAASTYKVLQDNKALPFKSPTIGQGLDFARSITVQPLARIGAEGVMSLTGDKGVYDPKSFSNPDIARFLYGEDKLRNWNDPKRPAREFLRSTGMAENQVNQIAPFLIFSGLALDVFPPTAGKGKLAKEGVEIAGKEVVTRAGKKVAKEEALTTLKGLLTYEDELARRGFSEAERAQYSLRKAQELFQWDSASAERVLNQARVYAGEKRNSFNKLFSTWIGQRDAAVTTGVSLGKKFADIPVEHGWDVVKLLEDSSAKVAPEAKKYIPGIRTEYNQLFTEAKKAKIDIGFLKDYVTHIWSEPANIVAEKMKGASQSFKFAKERKFLTYEEGIAAGLTPKYTHPAEIMAEYTKRLEQTKANIQFVEGLKKEGLIVDTAVGRGKLGFTAITGPGFPVSKSKNYAGEVITGEYYAPTEIAQVVNRLFAPVEETVATKLVGASGKTSRVLQDITLSGGIPKTPFNAFSITAGLLKDWTAGRFGATADFLRSFSAGKSEEFFKANVDQIKKMQLRNIPIHSTYDIEHLIDRGVVENNFGKGIGHAWDSMVNEPTFKRYWPQMQIGLFNNVEKSMLSKGKSAEEAADIAAKAVKNFYGTIESATQAKRSQFSQDAVSTVFFAPKFRESMINFWVNTAKAVSPVARKEGKFILNNPLAPENIMNTRFVVGAIATYVGMSKLNEHFTGKPMSQNPPGTEDKLLIPVSEITGDKKDTTVIGIPFLPSIGTVPRALIGAGMHAKDMNFPQVLNDAKAFTSTLFRTPADLVTNQNYFGQQIYNPEESKDKQLKDMGLYTLGNLSHPYMRAGMEAGLVPGIEKKDQPLYQTLSKAAELPIRYYTEKGLQGREYYAVHDSVYKSLTDQEKAVFDTLAKKSNGSLQQSMAEAQLRLANPSVVRAEAKIAFDTAKKTGQMVDPFYQLPDANQRVVLNIASLPPGDSAKSQLTSQNIGWLKEYWSARSQFFDEIKAQNPEKQFAENNSQPSADIQKKLDEYYALPKGTGQRTAYSQANPDLVEYWNIKKQATNSQRAELGLPPVPETTFSSGYKKSFKPFNRYASLKTKKLSVKLPKTKKVKIKPAKLSLKIPKYKGRVIAKVKIPRGSMYA